MQKQTLLSEFAKGWDHYMDERQAGNQQTKQIKNAYLFIKALL